jgi:hypothetical protein
MKKILFGLAMCLVGLGLASEANAAVPAAVKKVVGHRGYRGGYYRSHGVRFHGGYYYRGYGHHHWGRRIWSPVYHRYHYWDTYLSVWYFWDPIRGCWYPVGY